MITPVVLIIFNRPEWTLRVFNEIARAKPKKFMVIADGPRQSQPSDEEKCEQSRAIIKSINWDCEVLTHFSDINLGCGRRVSSGLDWVFSQVEEAIVLEDDCLPSQSFFKFCEELLDRYRHDERITHISGVNYQYKRDRTEYSYYFSRYCHVWGWATWRRAWKNYDFNMKQWPEFRRGKWLKDLLGNKKAARYWEDGFEQMYLGRADIWDVRWMFASWKENGLSIIPNKNLVSNIGFGLDATHTVKEGKYSKMHKEEMAFPLVHPSFIVRDAEADSFSESDMFSGKPFFLRIYNKILRMLSFRSQFL